MRSVTSTVIALYSLCTGEPRARITEPAPAASSQVVVAADDPREPTRRAAHAVLAQYCGECHEGHRPTAKPAALAIFDLDKPDWPSRFDDDKFKSALGRLSGKSPAARDAFVAFRDAELAAQNRAPSATPNASASR